MHICLTEMAQRHIAAVLGPGEGAIDATAGNGHDTLFLARRVGEKGKVFAFDVQSQALERARKRLAQEDLTGRMTWIHQGHEHMATAIPAPWRQCIRVVMFNLGYLPRGDKRLITRPDTTLVALEQAVCLLSPGGRISIVAYTGHTGGEEETEAVHQWLSCQPSDLLSWRVIVPEGQRHPPRLFLITKLKKQPPASESVKLECLTVLGINPKVFPN